MSEEIATAKAAAKLMLKAKAAYLDPVKFLQWVWRTPEGEPLQLAWFHHEWVDLMLHKRRLIMEAPKGCGKCVAGDTEIYDLSSGRRRTAAEVGRYTTPSVTPTGKLVVSEADAFASGEKDCVSLTLASGDRVILSNDHPVLTNRGWVFAEEIRLNDLIGTPRSYPDPADCTELTDDEIVFVAYLLADGCTVKASTPVFTNQDPAILAEFSEVAGRLADPIAFDSPSSGNASDIRVRKAGHLIERFGLRGKAVNKRTPADFYGLPQRQIALFLNRFWACDGSIPKPQGSRTVAEVTLASEKLIDDLRFLLLRVGVRSRKAFKKSHYILPDGSRKHFPAWRLTVSGSDNVLHFLDTVGAPLGKEEAWRRARDVAASTEVNTNVDRVPINSDVLREIEEELDGVSAEVKDRYGWWSYYSKKCYWFGRARFQRLCAELRYTGKHAWLADTDLYWMRVKAIEAVGPREVFDLSVDETSNFIGNNIVLHNTSILCAMAVWMLGRNPNIRIKIAAAKDSKAQERLFEIRENIVRNPLVRLVFPKLRIDKNGERSKSKLFIERSGLLRDASVEAAGILSSVGGGRADLILADDIVDVRNCLIYPKLRETVKMKFTGEWLGCLEPKGRVWYIANPMHRADTTSYLKLATGWTKHRIANGTDDDPYAPIWPERHSREYLMRKASELGQTEYDRAYRCVTLQADSTPIRQEWIQWYNSELLGDPYKLICIQAYDLAISRKKSSDYFAGVTVLYNPKRNHIFVADAWKNRITFTEQGHSIINEARAWNPDQIIIESVGYQGALADYLFEKAGPLPVQLVHPHTNKTWRVQQTQPLFENGQIFFNPALDSRRNPMVLNRGDLIGELLEFPHAKWDDLVDAFAYAIDGIRQFRMDAGDEEFLDGSGMRTRISVVGG